MKKIFYYFIIIFLITLPFIIANRFRKNVDNNTNKIQSKTFFSFLFSKPKLVLILDDAGKTNQYFNKIKKLNKNITIAVIPYYTSSKAIGLKLKNEGFNIIAHIPMEPIDNTKMDVKEAFLLTNDSIQVISTKIDFYINDILPFVTGINNHMGSLFTSNKNSMINLMKILKKKNLFFIDSLTINSSVGYKYAKIYKVPTINRDIFLDNQDDEVYIKKQLDKLLKIAMKKGFAVGIGHITKEKTINVLLENQDKILKNFNLIPPSKILE